MFGWLTGKKTNLGISVVGIAALIQAVNTGDYGLAIEVVGGMLAGIGVADKAQRTITALQHANELAARFQTGMNKGS